MNHLKYRFLQLLKPGFIAVAPMAWAAAVGEQRYESFEKDPGWDGHNNRLAKPETVRQDFGWSAGTTHAGGDAGEIGGLITPAAEPAYFAKKLAVRTFND